MYPSIDEDSIYALPDCQPEYSDDVELQERGAALPIADRARILPTTNAAKYVRVPPADADGTERILSFNQFPSGDRVHVRWDEEKGCHVLTIEHMMTTGLGGNIGHHMYNYVLKNDVITTYAKEAHAYRRMMVVPALGGLV